MGVWTEDTLLLESKEDGQTTRVTPPVETHEKLRTVNSSTAARKANRSSRGRRPLADGPGSTRETAKTVKG
jgi:hypothetical protein